MILLCCCRWGSYPDLQDTAMFYPGNGYVQAFPLKTVARLGDAAHLFQYPAGYRRCIADSSDREQVVHPNQIGGAINEITAVFLAAELLDHFVVFVPDLAHQFFHYIL